MNVDPFILLAYIIGVITTVFDVGEYNRAHASQPIDRKIHPAYCLLSWVIIFLPRDIKVGWIWKESIGKVFRKFFYYY